MMITMLNEEGLTFKEIEEEIFKMVCEWGQSFARELLERYDQYLMENRDKKAYRNKGLRETTVKTVFGEVNYSRRVYEITRESGLKEFVYLLDEQLRIPGVGLVSQNLADQLVAGITEMSYRETAEKVTKMTGQSISAMGVWKVIQSLGEKVCEEEAELVREYKAGNVQGNIVTSVLFEEADGVYVNLQREKKKKAEIKVGIAYDGWKEKGRERYILDEKVVVAGFSKAKEFQEYREASIAEKYNTDEVKIRLMNADGAEWIKHQGEGDTIFQLDPFHRNKAIKDCVPYKDAVRSIYEFLDYRDLKGLFEYLEIYKDSLSNDQEIEKAEKLIKYFANNREGLLSYQDQGIELPEPPKGLHYRNMGTMENHIWSTIAKRMKHNHTCWSYRGGNHLAKILARKCSGRLNEVAAQLKSPRFERHQAEIIQKEIMSAGHVPQKEGKGYRYPVSGHLTRLDGTTGITHQMYMQMVGC